MDMEKFFRRAGPVWVTKAEFNPNDDFPIYWFEDIKDERASIRERHGTWHKRMKVAVKAMAEDPKGGQKQIEAVMAEMSLALNELE